MILLRRQFDCKIRKRTIELDFLNLKTKVIRTPRIQYDNTCRLAFDGVLKEKGYRPRYPFIN